VDAKTFLINRIKKHLPVLLKNHKKDIVVILSTLEGVSPEEYTQTLDLRKIMTDFTELLTDNAFKDLFISAQKENSSTSAQENIEGQKK